MFRSLIDDNQNPGLALRWVAALAEMEPTLAIPGSDWRIAKTLWKQEVMIRVNQEPLLDELSQFHKYLTPMVADSVVSIVVKNRANGKSLTKSELQYLYQAMTMDLSDKINWKSDKTDDDKFAFEIPDSYEEEGENMDREYWTNISSKICYIGQPIKVSDDMGVVRIALGSDSLRQVISDLKRGNVRTQ